MLASLTAFQVAYAQSDLFGKLVILTLIGLSVLCWVVLLYKTWMIRKVERASLAFREATLAHEGSVLNLDLATLPTQVRGAPHPFAGIFQATKQKALEVLNKNHYFLSKQGGSVHLTPSDLDLLEAHAQVEIGAQNKVLEKNLYILSTIVTLAPFMGLLGTVWGILVSFSGLHDGAGMGSNSAILGGLSTALATTVLGLIIAIPALIAYNYLKNTLRHYDSDMEGFLSELLTQIELQYRKVE